ncbi:UNVERIFIED_CONTAM: hypothetical protein Sradi_1359800 [Sesamum radiatum]|uniref:Uncharacterized protein n=1 Tax=Sesamum radiatum TaxID=300843 RepID=A0AAW2USI3_SESRA
MYQLRFPLYLQMKKDWFTADAVESFCKRLDSFPVTSSDHEDSASVDSSNSVELIETSFFDKKLEKVGS